MQWPEKGSMISKWTDGEPFVASFWSEKNEKWYGRQLTLDAKAATLVTDSWVDPAPAKSVDELIAKIQVQVRTDTTDADCAAAKEAWDALSDDEKALVQEYDYFGLDTGDASKDDPLNQDGISENEILVVSFGTSFNDSRVATIGGVEKALQAANPDWSVRRAFTAQIIINHIQARDGEKIDNMQQALDRAVANGVKNLVIAPTHLMHGAEYDELVEALDVYKSQMNITIAEPLLGQVGADGTVVNADKEAVAKAVVAAAAQNANYADAAAAATDGAAIVLMGHGTAHEAAVTYEQMQTQMDQLGYTNVFVGTVEGEPASTECQAVIQKVKDAGYKKVFLRPLMVVAGDHANNDMADAEDPESWVSQFTAAEAFDSVQCQIAGLGEIEAIQQIYVDHVKAALEGASAAATVAEQIAALTENSTAEDVKAARDAYDALSDAQKALVDEEPLLKAEKALADAAAAAAAEAAAADDATLEQKLAAAEAKAAAAEAAQKVAAAAQAKAEQAKNWAEKSQQDAQKEAKAAKAAAEAAQAEADAAKSAAETAKAEADAAKAAAETAQTEAETQKAAAEQAQAAQAKAEGEAKAAKDAQAKAEKATASAMQKNTISVQAKQVKAKAKKKTTVAAKKAFTVTNAKGKVSYYKIGGNDKKNNVTVKANGKIVVKKGLKKGKTVKVKVLVVDSGNANYTPSTAIVTLKIKVTK
ncbi:MAG TPA: hypothetical protein DCP91_11930 [Eggerthellaceae bacterium]|nr:hypothetical protein [Eggerthellaceae bacterium]